MAGSCEVCGGTGLESQDKLCPDCDGYGDVDKFIEIKKRDECFKEESMIVEEVRKFNEEREKLNSLFKEHLESVQGSAIKTLDCCKEAKEYGNIRYTTGQFVDPYNYIPESGWYLVYDEWHGYDRISFCPFCGQEMC